MGPEGQGERVPTQVPGTVLSLLRAPGGKFREAKSTLDLCGCSGGLQEFGEARSVTDDAKVKGPRPRALISG